MMIRARGRRKRIEGRMIEQAGGDAIKEWYS
jgi:hypothetical protein